MAWKSVVEKEEHARICPKCRQNLITIDGKFIKWLTCINPACKFKKLLEKEREVVKVYPIEEEKERRRKKEPQKLKVKFE